MEAYVRRFQIDPPVKDAFFDSVNRFHSDFDRAQVLLACLSARAVDSGNRDAFVAAADRIRSNYDQNRVLAALVKAERK
jgi:hypothetical protein